MPIPAIALETSGRTSGVAVCADGRVVASETFDYGLANAARVLPIIDSMTKGQGWGPGDLREMYISIGPGSFTGLRIAVTVAKMLSFATGAAIAAVPSTTVLAHNAPADAKNVLVVLDARRGKVFSARFVRDGDAI